MTDYVLALHPATDGCGSFDPSAVLFVDGRLAFGVEEERLVREKHAPGRFPTRSVRACLRYCGISLADVDRVVVPWGDDAEEETSKGTSPTAAVERRLAGTDLGSPVPPVTGYGHHRSHAASAFFPSGFDEAVVVTADGRGNRWSTAVWAGDERGLRRRTAFAPPNSLGYFYAAVTAYLGFQPFGGEGKLMALAGYGERDADIESALRSVVTAGADYDVTGLVGEGVPSAVSRLEDLFDRPRGRAATPDDQWAANLACVTQRTLEETVVSLVERHCERQGRRQVCLAGGVALNCKLNRRVAESTAIERTYVQPVANDAGAPVGAGLLAVDEPRRCEMGTLALGPASATDDVERLVSARGLDASRPDSLERAVAARLAAGDVVGWFQGRAGFGPRALGNRSVLADPRDEDAAARVNAFVKRREAWRPLAPSLPAEVADRYLVSSRPSPYMIDAFAVDPTRRAEIPAVVHPADGTTRPQTVREADRPRYHRLLTAFGERTGVPVLLNTSFNARGEPIVTTPTEALDTFESTALDVFVLDDLVVES